jgi:integrase
LCKVAGIEGRVPHELRHTAGSVAVDAGVPLTEVADQLGHADVNMLARTYRHRTRPVVEGVAGVMDAFVSPRKRTRKSDA